MAYFILSLQVVDDYICYIVDNLEFYPEYTGRRQNLGSAFS